MAGLAAPQTATAADATQEQQTSTYLLFRLGDECYALPSEHVRELSRWREPTPVPGAPPVMPGIINQRGLVLPVVRLGLLLGLSDTAPDRTTRYIYAQHADIALALLIDEVIDLVPLAPATFEAVPPTLSPRHGRLFQGIARRDGNPIVLLNLAEIVAALRGEN